MRQADEAGHMWQLRSSGAGGFIHIAALRLHGMGVYYRSCFWNILS